MHCLGRFGFPKERSHLQTQRCLCQPARNTEEPRKTKTNKQNRKKKNNNPNPQQLFFHSLVYWCLCNFLWWFVDFALTDICYLLNQGFLRQQ